jgi:DNA polymerase-3 subunit gamma/tau
MAAQTLYRKWRSQTFDELIGQDHVVRTLRNAISEERVAHAYLFTGPRGVGKTSMARLLAKAVNCLAPDPTDRPCGQCESCQTIAEGRAVDIVEMDAASHTSVDDARELIERVQFRPTLARTKVYVIDECHMLSTAAFNALLKTLEEPPAHALFILATTEVHKVPATILSRCQRFTFARHNIVAIAAHLQQIAAEEGLILADGVAESIARAATGSMRDALGVLEQVAAFGSGEISLEQVQSLLGMTSAAEVDALVAALLAGDTAGALRAIQGVADQGADIRQFTRDLVERLRQLLLFSVSEDRSILNVSEDELQQLHDWHSAADPGQLVTWVRLFSNQDYQLRTSPYGHLPLELAVIEAIVGSPTPPARPAQPAVAKPRTGNERRQATRPTQAAPQTPPAATERVASRATAPPDQMPAPTQAPAGPAGTPPTPTPSTMPDSVAMPTPEVGASVPTIPEQAAESAEPGHATAWLANAEFSILEQIEADWPAIVRDVRPHSPTVQALLKGVHPIDVQGRTITLLATSTFHKENLEKPTNRTIVEEVIKSHLGETFAISCTIEGKPESRDLRQQIREARKDKLVRAAMNIFDAQIIDIEEPDHG